MKLVQDWRQAPRWASMWAMTGAGAIQATWLGIPADMKASIPSDLVMWITIILMVLGSVGRLIDQK